MSCATHRLDGGVDMVVRLKDASGNLVDELRRD